jgi:hypothetical protein
MCPQKNLKKDIARIIPIEGCDMEIALDTSTRK